MKDLENSVKEDVKKKENNWDKEDYCKAYLKLNYRHSSSDNCNTDCVKKYIKSKPRYYYQPYPICQGTIHNKIVDPLLSLIQCKQEFQRKVDKIKSAYKSHQVELQISEQFKCYKDLQSVLNTDPDKYFSSNYNWYYTGGNLQLEKLAGKDLIFYSKNNTQLSVVNIERNLSNWSVKEKEILNEHYSPIYQIDSLNNSEKILLSVREKFKVSLLDFTSNENKFGSAIIDSKLDPIPFVGISFNKQGRTEFTTLNAKQVVKIWDIATSKETFQNEISYDIDKLYRDHFAQIKYHNNNSLAYINRLNCYFFDTRENCIANIKKINGEDILKNNDRLTNLCLNKNNETFIYLSTFRDVLQVDLRNLSVCKKWSHSFSSAPFLSDCINIENREMMCISSRKSNEKFILEQRNNENYIPITLPTIAESFESSLMKTRVMNMSLKVKERFDISTTGLQMSQINDKTVAIFTSNALGDLYCYEISDDKTNNDSDEIFQTWNNEIETHHKNNINVLQFIDKVVLHNVELNYNMKPARKQNSKKSACLQKIVRNLKKRQKGHNNKITEAWFGVTDAPDLNNIEELPPHLNVKNWLNTFSGEVSGDE